MRTAKEIQERIEHFSACYPYLKADTSDQANVKGKLEALEWMLGPSDEPKRFSIITKLQEQHHDYPKFFINRVEAKDEMEAIDNFINKKGKGARLLDGEEILAIYYPEDEFTVQYTRTFVPAPPWQLR